MDSETLLLRRRKRPEAVRKLSLDEVWPVHSAGPWSESLSLITVDRGHASRQHHEDGCQGDGAGKQKPLQVAVAQRQLGVLHRMTFHVR